MPKKLKMYSFEEMAKARKEGFLDAIQVISDIGLDVGKIEIIAKVYESLWRRQYYEVINE